MLIAVIILVALVVALREQWVSAYTIRAGNHRAWPWRFGLYINPKKLQWQVRFDGTSYYTFSDVDDGDINKLVGIAYWPGIHKSSARFGWRNYRESKVELFAYTYDKGVRAWKSIAIIDRYVDYELTLNCFTDKYCFSVFDTTKKSFYGFEVMPKTHNQKIGVRCGLFFGGNRTAPHDMKVYLKRL